MSYDPNQITFFAKTDARGKEVPFGIKASDRTRHVYVIGKTGMGKSTLLENMAVQDIKNGNGLAFIDPHGQTAETLLNYIPEERKKDVLYFAPFDAENPVAFNVMEDVGPDRRHLVVSGLMSVFKKIWVDAWSARMEYILQNTLLALLEYPDSTLLGVNRMLSDKDYRRKVIDNITDPSVKSFWVDEFLKYNERYMQEAGDSIKNKIGQFTANPLIRNIIGQPHSSFDIRKMMDEKKIIIMNLSKGLIGESNANLLGSMLTTRIYLAAMSRADLSQEQMKEMPNFYFYVDEFQSFANATFADILSEARKYKLNLTIAHQYIEQMEEEVRNAVFGNVGTIIAFRVGPFDAEVLESIFTPKFLAPDIVNLGFAQVYLTLMIDGIGSQPFSATTLPPIEQTSVSCKDMVIAQSKLTFSKPRSEVEAAIYAWHETKDGSMKPRDTEKPTERQNNPVQRPTESVASNPVRNTDDRPSFAKPNTEEGKKEYIPKADSLPDRANPRQSDSQQKRTDGNTRTPWKKEGEKSDGGNRSSSNARPQRNDKSQPRVPNAKSLEDLRSVLKSISSVDETKKETKTTAVKVEKKNESEKPDESPLKLALANALKDVEKQKPVVVEAVESKKTEETKTVIEAKISVPETVVPPKESPSQTLADVPTPTPVVKPDVSAYAQMKNIDPLSPKKLERMMRITANDKSPLK